MSGYDMFLTPDLERHLLSLYFACVSLPVPIFSKAKFYQEYEADYVPRFVLSAMFALSSRFCEPSKVLGFGFGNESLSLMGQDFGRKAAAELGHMTKSNQAISMNEVKAAYLLAVYHFTNLSLREGWEQCSRATSMAYMLRLHQIDNPNADSAIPGSNSKIDKEEKRCVWWAIYTLDCFSSLVTFVPSGIDDLSVATSIPAALLSETPASILGPSPSALVEPRLPDDEMDWSRCVLQDSSSPGAKLQAALIFAHSLAHEASHLRRVAHENPRCNLQDRLKSLQQKWNSIFTVLPPYFFLPGRHEQDKTAQDHCKRLEVLNVFYVTGAMASVPPLAMDLHWPIGQFHDSSFTIEGRWKDCITYALNIAAAYREWAPEYFDKADPIMLPITWTAGSLLALQLMNEALVDATEKIALLDALDVLMTSLRRTSRYWGIAGILLRSLEALRGRAWIKLDLQAIIQLILCVWSPLMQDLPKDVGTTPEPCIPVAPESSTLSDNTDGLLDMASLAWAPDELLSTLGWLGSGQDMIVPSL
ncbi:fungal-specific transcription factor domain-containing protein [Dactylonectria macrodidyma]|uniref:Fungal-specific transcription factor domain-containing protein n=1 Tax=Dactylonectria macrodidyma TaxID=307937 RepID=A0A9P9EQ05_9HYPO|nr:fungal-specific transcription factor domain-containing protein [Dactylonectria macrodidyma]